MRIADATAEAEDIRSGRTSASDVLETYLDRIRRFNPRINAVVVLHEKRARAMAKRADELAGRGEFLGPLHGVPMTVKEMFDTAGDATTFGWPLLWRNIPREDAAVVAALRAAGAILIGKTNVALGGYDWQSRNPRYGRTQNPWRLDVTCGGSSGGSAAAVAARFAAFDYGSDLAGSLRIPAAFCGVFTHKATERRIPEAGHAALPRYPRAVRRMLGLGPVTRSVRDLRLLLSLTEERSSATPPMRRGPSRFAVAPQFDEVPTALDITAVMQATAADLRAAGHEVVGWDNSRLDIVALTELWGEVNGCELATVIPTGVRTAVALFMMARFSGAPFTRGLLRGLRSDARARQRVFERREQVAADIDAALGSYDALLCPVVGVPAFAHCRTGRAFTIGGARASYGLALGGYAMPFNVGGNPAVVVPTGLGDDGLPRAVQLIAPRGRDYHLLDAAAAVEHVVVPIGEPPLA